MGMLQATTGSFKFATDTKVGYVPQFRNLDADYPHFQLGLCRTQYSFV